MRPSTPKPSSHTPNSLPAPIRIPGIRARWYTNVLHNHHHLSSSLSSFLLQLLLQIHQLPIRSSVFFSFFFIHRISRGFRSFEKKGRVTPLRFFKIEYYIDNSYITKSLGWKRNLLFRLRVLEMSACKVQSGNPGAGDGIRLGNILCLWCVVLSIWYLVCTWQCLYIGSQHVSCQVYAYLSRNSRIYS